VRESGWHEAVQPDGQYRVLWRTTTGSIPANEHFGLELCILHGPALDEPWPGRRLLVSAFMPEHNHGMLVKPDVEDLGDGTYRARPLLMHMSGHWELRFDLVSATGDVSRAKTDVVLP
jgi:hypothetical protein